MKKLAAIVAAVVLALSGCSWPFTTPTQPTSSIPPSATGTQGKSLSVYFLDVGQGDAEVVTIGDKTMLIDAGTNASTETLLSDINSLHINRFDIVIGTHPHEDHIGGLDAVINQFSIGTIYMPKVSTTTKTFTDVLNAISTKGLTVSTPAPGTLFALGAAQCTIVAPNGQAYDDLNGYSIAIRLVYGNTSFLFTGDAQVDSEQEMLSKGYDLNADVLKVGHHGSSTSSSLPFLQAVKPTYAIIEVGAGNDYGHPSQTTLTLLAGVGATVYRTDLSGTVTITSDGANVAVSTER